MKTRLITGCLCLLMAATVVGCAEKTVQNDYPIRPVSFVDVKLTDSFWAPRMLINHEVTIPIALEQCYGTGRIDNFKKAAGLMEGYHGTEYPFDDSDVFKIIEGASYSYRIFPDPELGATMDSIILYIGMAQEPDGYLLTARTAGEPGKLHPWLSENRWEKAPDLSHELYNMGHLYEAAVAHYQATGKRTLLDVAIKNADLIVRDFGPGKLQYEPGHQVIEMGLTKLYRVTGNKDYLDMAKFFLDLKGNGERGEYCQSHKPVIEQDEAVGHAVRAAYMYSGMADVAALAADQSYMTAIDRIWDNVVTKKLYVTGGIGATNHGEAFGKNYELPNATAYCETCAAIANVYWNHRQFLMHGDSKYYDVLERTLYNGVISGISLAGDRFFYPNPLESHGNHERKEWFGCACCPSNICRFMASLPGYMYAAKDNNVYVNLFAQSEATVGIDRNEVMVSQRTDYPWDGHVELTVSPAKEKEFGIKVRIPGWVQGHPVPGTLYTYLNDAPANVEVKVNGESIEAIPSTDGYLNIHRKWQAGDKIEIDLPMEVRRTLADERVEADRGRVSLERGPIVYCLESPDNGGTVLNTVLSDDAAITVSREPEMLNGIMVLRADAGERAEKSGVKEKGITAIPYYSWANRGRGEMMVWIPRQ